MITDEIVSSPMSWDESFMRDAYNIANKSKDPSSKVGAVLVADKDKFSSGYNGFPRGIMDLNSRLNDRETKYKYVIHSEVNAILNAARMGKSTLCATMYTIGMPCSECAKAIIQAGITEVVIHANKHVNFTHGKWADSCAFSKNLFDEAGVKVRIFDKHLGIQTLVNKEWKEV